jgi:hypothetical protein
MTEVRIMMMGEKSLTSEQELGAPSGKVIFVTTVSFCYFFNFIYCLFIAVKLFDYFQDVQDGDVLWTDPHTDMHIAMRMHFILCIPFVYVLITLHRPAQ